MTVVLTLALILLLMSQGLTAAAEDTSTTGHEPLMPVIVTLSDGPRITDRRAVRRLGGEVDHAFHLIPAMAARLPESRIEELKEQPGVIAVEPDSQVHALGQVLPWGVDRIDADAVHGYNQGDGVKVAVIDTGIDLDHPDLVVEGHVSFVLGSPTGDDDNGHGTHVAGIVAASNNTIGIVGTAPQVRLYAVKALDANGSGTWSGFIQAIEWAVDNEMEVVNLSLGSQSAPAAAQTALDTAHEAGVVLVAAAGNEGNPLGIGDNITFPARFDSVIAVAAVDQSDQRASFSSTGPAAELAAPGVGILTTLPNGDYRPLSGTSVATPHVAGVAALVLANGDLRDLDGDGAINGKDVRLRLQDAVLDLGPTGRDTATGFGLLDAGKAAPLVANLPPVASDDTASVDAGGTIAIDVLANDTDADGDALTVTNLSRPLNGTASLNDDQTVQYTPEPGFNGTDSFSYTANDGTADSNAAIVTILVGLQPPPPPNQAPVADTGPDQTVQAGQPVTLDGSGSFDSDGSIVTTSWSFGDGGSATGLEVTHTYAEPGTYTATLTVTDDDEATDSDSATITVTPASLSTLHVEAIDMALTARFGGWRTFATATVEVRDQSGYLVAEVVIEGHWEGATSDTDSETSAAAGQATLESNVLRKPPAGATFRFVVDDLLLSGFIYDEGADEESEDSISVQGSTG